MFDSFGMVRRRTGSGHWRLCFHILLFSHYALAFIVPNFQFGNQILVQLHLRRSKLRSATVDAKDIGIDVVSLDDEETDNRPWELRNAKRRTARRLNHGFRYLYRFDSANLTENSTEYFLENNYTMDQIIEMNQSFPYLLNLSVTSQLHPKMQFLQHTLGIPRPSEAALPPQIFGARLERILAPRHAFLTFRKLYHGAELLQGNRLDIFLSAGRKPQRFAELCRSWQNEICSQQDSLRAEQLPESVPSRDMIKEFDTLFARGLMAAARNDTQLASPKSNLNISSADLLELLIGHGGNPLERDHRGVSLLHWAAGVGSIDNIRVLKSFWNVTNCTTERDDATVLHWAAAGTSAKNFGSGGHSHVCEYLLSREFFDDSTERRKFVNRLTKDGNSAVMWAAWSGTLTTVKLLVRNRANLDLANRNGCTIAHWAASGGNLKVCQYLHDIMGVDFSLPNHGGNTPLTHAVAFGHVNIVEWLKKVVAVKNTDSAQELAQNFVDWTGDADAGRRRQILSLFEAIEKYDNPDVEEAEAGVMAAMNDEALY